MITDNVIKEIYKRYKKPPRTREELNLEHSLEVLDDHHTLEHIKETNPELDEIINKDIDEFNPFRRFLIRSLHGIIEFDRWVAFIFKNHILFFSKHDKQMQIHIRQEQKKPWYKKLFGGD